MARHWLQKQRQSSNLQPVALILEFSRTRNLCDSLLHELALELFFRVRAAMLIVAGSCRDRLSRTSSCFLTWLGRPIRCNHSLPFVAALHVLFLQRSSPGKNLRPLHVWSTSQQTRFNSDIAIAYQKSGVIHHVCDCGESVSGCLTCRGGNQIDCCGT